MLLSLFYLCYKLNIFHSMIHSLYLLRCLLLNILLFSFIKWTHIGHHIGTISITPQQLLQRLPKVFFLIKNGMNGLFLFSFSTFLFSSVSRFVKSSNNNNSASTLNHIPRDYWNASRYDMSLSCKYAQNNLLWHMIYKNRLNWFDTCILVSAKKLEYFNLVYFFTITKCSNLF